MIKKKKERNLLFSLSSVVAKSEQIHFLLLLFFLHAFKHYFAVTAEIYRTLRMNSENELITNDTSGNIMCMYSQFHADNV